MVIKIAVIGAGVIGLASAVQVLEYFQDLVDVTILTEDLSPNTTGDGSAGLWGPYLCGSTSTVLMKKWGQISHEYFHGLWKNGLAKEAGITLIPTERFTDEKQVDHTFWKDIVFGYQKMTPEEIRQTNSDQSRKFLSGARFLTFTCEPSKWLPFLLQQFQAAGGQLKQQHIFSFDDIANDYDLIINCAGISARKIANDPLVIPIRGQVMYTHAPWQLHAILDDSDVGNYIIPNMDIVVLGGTHQYDDFNRNVDAKDSTFIRVGCCEINKSFQNVIITKEWVGLRPGRETIRLDVDTFETKSGRKINVIHNYGHGGCGVTFAWGCAADVVGLIRKIVNKNGLMSKL